MKQQIFFHHYFNKCFNFNNVYYTWRDIYENKMYIIGINMFELIPKIRKFFNSIEKLVKIIIL